MNNFYYSANQYFKDVFGCKVHRISIDAGFTCPNRDGTKGTGGCIYCNENGSRANYVKPDKSISEQIIDGINVIKKKYNVNKFIAYFQPFTNTYGDIDHLEKVYNEALNFDEVVGISIGTRPDCLDKDKIELINSIAQKKWTMVELGIQTLNDKSLEFINRKHDSKITLDTLLLLSKYEKINKLAHLIYRLPYDNEESFIECVKTILNYSVKHFKFHNLYVEKNTYIEELYKKNLIELQSLDEYIIAMVKILKLLPEDVVIHRIFSDCDRDRLIAPMWQLNKTENYKILEKYFYKIREN